MAIPFLIIHQIKVSIRICIKYKSLLLVKSSHIYQYMYHWGKWSPYLRADNISKILTNTAFSVIQNLDHCTTYLQQKENITLIQLSIGKHMIKTIIKCLLIQYLYIRLTEHFQVLYSNILWIWNSWTPGSAYLSSHKKEL